MTDFAPIVYNMHHRLAPPNAKYIGRGSPYGNPFVIGRDGTREEVIEKFKERLLKDAPLIAKIKSELRGEDLVCFCAPLPCHGDVIREIANE